MCTFLFCSPYVWPFIFTILKNWKTILFAKLQILWSEDSRTPRATIETRVSTPHATVATTANLPCLLWPWSMEAQWIATLAVGGIYFILGVFWVCLWFVLIKKARRWWILEDGIRFSSPRPFPAGVFSFIEGCAEVSPTDLAGFNWCLSSMDLDRVYLRPCSCVFRLNPSNPHFSSATTVFVLVRWSFWTLACRLLDCLL